MQIDSTVHPFLERGIWRRPLAPNKVVNATTIRVRLVRGDLPVVVGGLPGAFSLEAVRISNLVLLQGQTVVSDGRPSEIIPGADVLPVADICKLLCIALPNELGFGETRAIRDDDFNKLAIPSLITERILGDLDTETVLDPFAN